MTQVKSSRAPMPWESDPIVGAEEATPTSAQETGTVDGPWMNDPVVEQTAPGLSADNIDPDMEAPALVRAQVGALDKPEDRLAALRQSYPDAQPHGDGNFIMTDPETGKTMIYNRESWVPSGGDFASILPEVGEGVGGILGGIGGFIGGGAAGSAVPVVGTAVGAGAGAITGAGAGATVGRETVQRGLNWAFGNEDTRTTEEQLGDAAKTFALNAGGQALGMGAGAIIGKAAKAIGPGGKNLVAGAADDPVKAAQRIDDFKAVGAKPTAGMVNGQPSTATREQALAQTRAGKPIADRIAQAFDANENAFTRNVSEMAPQTLTRQEMGEELIRGSELVKEQIKNRGDYLYNKVAEKTGDAPALGQNTRSFLERLQTERNAMGKSASLNAGPKVDQVIEQAKAITDDIGSGVNFNVLKEARTNIRMLRDDKNIDPVLRSRMGGLYDALTADMEATAASSGADALQAWRKANNFSFRNSKGSWGTQDSIDPILKAETPEKAADYLLAQVNKGGTRLNAIRRQLERTEGGANLWNTLTGSTVERMGIVRGADGIEMFDQNRMFREWAKLSPEAKDAMFKGTARKKFRDNFEIVARNAANLKEYRRFDNHSGTQKAVSALEEFDPFNKNNLLGAVVGFGVSGGAPGAIVAAGGRAVGSFVAKRWQAKLLTSDETVEWLANLGKAQMQKGGLKAHVAKLAQMGRTTTDQSLRVAINDYLREVKYEE